MTKSLILLLVVSYTFLVHTNIAVSAPQVIESVGEIGVGLKEWPAVLPTLKEMVEIVMGKVSKEALINHATFESYWASSSNSRAGYALEATFSDTFNRRAGATSLQTRILPTKYLGHTHSAADLFEIDKAGKVIAEYQCKLGHTQMLEALDDPKYANMKLVTTEETLKSLKDELAQKKVQARSLPLSDKMKQLDDALNSGRLLQKSPCGAPLPTKEFCSKVAREVTENLYHTAKAQTTIPLVKSSPSAKPSKASKAPEVPNAGKSGNPSENPNKIPTSVKIGRGALKVVGVAGVAYEGYVRVNNGVDTERQYSEGQISEQQREIAHAKNIAGGGGSLGGGIVCAGYGAAYGSTFGPVGTFVGGVSCGIAGALVGEKALGETAAGAVSLIHSTGSTIGDGVTATGKWLGSWVGW